MEHENTLKWLMELGYPKEVAENAIYRAIDIAYCLQTDTQSVLDTFVATTIAFLPNKQEKNVEVVKCLS
jgi:hypothetical protein